MSETPTRGLSHSIGAKVVVVRPNQQSVIGWLGTDNHTYSVWDGGDTVRFTDDDIDFIEINFIHLKGKNATT